MITNDSQLLNAQACVPVIQAMLAHARRACAPESFEDQATGWLAGWDWLTTRVVAPRGDYAGFRVCKP